MIKLIGKKLISGDLNLTRISFPIKAMVPKTELENSTMACIFYLNPGCTMPYFMKRAAESKDPVERMKYVMSTVFSGFYYLNLFLKPVFFTFIQAEPSHRWDPPRVLPRRYQNILWTDFPPSPNQLLLSRWTERIFQILRILRLLCTCRTEFDDFG